VARAQCRLPFVGTPAVGNFAGTHTVTQAIQDPWAPATTTSTVAFTIANRPPSITSTSTYTDSSCAASATCCRTVEGTCEAYLSTAPGTASVPYRWADPDGDPISVEAGAVGSYTPVQPLVCVPSACVLEVAIAPMTVCLQSTVTYLPTTVGDGLATASGSLPMQVTCY